MELKLTVVLLWAGFWFASVGAWSAVLEKAEDVYFSWTLNGTYEYYPSGKMLEQLPDDLPPTFDYNNFRHAQGIWALFPNPPTDEPPVEAVATFGYTTRTYLIDYVTITYGIGRNATITLRKTLDSEPLYVIHASSEVEYQLLTTTVPLDPPVNEFVFEATVSEKPNFVIIDRIIANFVEVTTTTTPPPNSTTRVPPTPTANPIISKGSSTDTSSLIFLVSSLVFLIQALLI